MDIFISKYVPQKPSINSKYPSDKAVAVFGTHIACVHRHGGFGCWEISRTERTRIQRGERDVTILKTEENDES